MNKIHIRQRLTLTKERITKLQESQLSKLKGGVGDQTPNYSCFFISCKKEDDK